jgi:hypothetical protein
MDILGGTLFYQSPTMRSLQVFYHHQKMPPPKSLTHASLSSLPPLIHPAFLCIPLQPFFSYIRTSIPSSLPLPPYLSILPFPLRCSDLSLLHCLPLHLTFIAMGNGPILDVNHVLLHVSLLDKSKQQYMETFSVQHNFTTEAMGSQ